MESILVWRTGDGCGRERFGSGRPGICRALKRSALRVGPKHPVTEAGATTNTSWIAIETEKGVAARTKLIRQRVAVRQPGRNQLSEVFLASGECSGVAFPILAPGNKGDLFDGKPSFEQAARTFVTQTVSPRTDEFEIQLSLGSRRIPRDALLADSHAHNLRRAASGISTTSTLFSIAGK